MLPIPVNMGILERDVFLAQNPQILESALHKLNLRSTRRFVAVKSSQVNTLPKAKSQAKDKRAKDRQ